MLSGLIAFALASAFAGMALYVNVVEQPARLGLDDANMVKEWGPSDRRGFALLGGLAVLSALAGLIEYRSLDDVRWLLGALIVLASWPYTYFVIVPLNNRLLANPPGQAGVDSREIVTDWGVLQWGQTLLGLVASAVFAWALL